MRQRTRQRIERRVKHRRRLIVESLERRNLLAAIEVTTLLDVTDASDGLMSLREAIQSANANAGADEITFADALTSAGPAQLVLADGELLVTDTLVITGPGQELLAIDANGLSRVVNVDAAGGANSVVDLTLSGLTLSGGLTSGNNELVGGMRETTQSGGGVRFLSSGTLTLIQATLSGNATTGDRAAGGAIFTADGTVVLEHSTLSGNSTSGFGSLGGAVATPSGRVTLTNSSVSGNSTLGSFGFGGGVYTDSGNVTLTNSSLNDNRTVDDAPGGGIYSQFGNVSLANSTLSGNSTGDAASGGIGGDGGGIYAVYGTVTLTNSTVSNNSTTGDYADGGGIFTRSGDVMLSASTVSGNVTNGENATGGGIVTLSGNVSLLNSTLSGNQTLGPNSDGGGLWAMNSLVTITHSTVTANQSTASGGGLFLSSATSQQLTLHNSIVAGNTDAGTAPDFIAPSDPSANLEVKSSLVGNNLGTSLIASAAPDTNGNQIGAPTAIIDPLLGPLRNNGGPTLTHALLATSPALDAGDSSQFPAVTVTDQRGFTRTMNLASIPNAPSGDGTDIGAVEMVGVSITGGTSVENSGMLDFVVSISHPIPIGRTVSVEFSTVDIAGQAVGGVDYTAISNLLVTFVSGESQTQTISVLLSDDATYEGDETFSGVLTNPEGLVITSATALGTITDNDEPPTVTLAVDTTTIDEAAGTATFTATLSAASGLPVTVDLSFNGTATLDDDYTLSGTQIVIAPGQTTGSITVTAVADTVDDPNETIIVDVASVTGASVTTPQSATISIGDEPPLDFGDAPASYPVTLTNDGARHSLSALVLGATVDAEVDGQPSPAADGDGADEDGVVSIATALTSTAGNTKSSLNITASGDGKLDAWIDFNQDGDWDDADEQIFVSVDVVAGSNLLAYVVPAGALAGETFARFRLSSVGGLAATGAASDGEVEDHLLTLVDGDATSPLVVDLVQPSIIVTRDAGDSVVQSGSIELFRAASSLVGSIQLNGTDADNTFTVDFASGWVLPSGGIEIAGVGGVNTLQLQGAGDLDLTDPNVIVSDVSRIVLASDATNRLKLSAAAIERLAPDSSAVRITTGPNDQLTIVNPADWRMTAPEIVDGRYLVTATSQSGSAATLQVDSARPYLNILQAGDVNNSGDVSASDALAIIYELNTPQYTDAAGDLIDPASLNSLPLVYLDVNGDGRASAADALEVINILYLESLERATSEAEQAAPHSALQLKEAEQVDEVFNDAEFYRMLNSLF